MFHLYIDTNVLLSFYHFTTDELVELDKLRALLTQQKACLYLPHQTYIEFKRNRENKIADALKRMREQRLTLQYPQFCRDYPEYAELRKLESNIQKKFSALLMKATLDIQADELGADKAIRDLTKLAKRPKTTPEQISQAQLRVSLGNPPGKNGSLGDAINWQVLLDHVPASEDLIFISGDRDYASPLNDELFHSFLQDEWNTAKSSKVVFYKRIGGFFQDHFPNSPLATDLEKEALIKDLAAAGSFATTHSLVARLGEYKTFSKAQRGQLLEAALSNNQVYLIAEDEDVENFFGKLITGHESELDVAKVAEWRAHASGRPMVDGDSDEADDRPL